MRIGFVFGMACLLALSSLTAQAYRLQFKDTAGNKRVYNLHGDLNSSVNMGEMHFPVESKISMTMVEEVLSATGENASVSCVVRDASIEMIVSGVPGEEEAKSFTQALPEFTITYDRTALGKVSNVQVNGEMESMLAGTFGPMGSQLQNPAQNLEFPDRDLQIGDTWQVTQKVPLGETGELSVLMDYTLVDTVVVDKKNISQYFMQFQGKA